MTSPRRLIIVHDVLGTLFSLTSPERALQKHYPHLRSPELASFSQLIIYDWYHATQRDYATLSINGSYRPIVEVFRLTLPRALAQAGLEPQEGTTADEPYASVIKDIMESLTSLEPRPGMVDAFQRTYRDSTLVPQDVGAVDLWGATNGSEKLTRSLFNRALGESAGGELVSASEVSRASVDKHGSGVGVFSCDQPRVAKPHPDAYAAALRLALEKVPQEEERSLWFVASHSWDLFAAKKAGFKTAWVQYEEHHALPDLFGKPEIIAADLDEAARKILRWESGKEQS